MIIQDATAMNIRQNLGEYLNTVQYRHDPVRISKGGKPVAVIVDINTFEKMRLMKNQFEKMTQELQHTFEDLSETEISALTNEALQHVRLKG